MSAAPVEQLSSALEVTGHLIASTGEAQWALPTPCPGWNASDLINHLIAGNHGFARALRDQPAPAIAPTRATGGIQAAYRESAAELLDAFGQPDALEKVVTVPFGTVPGIVALHLRITELLVHGWDLAKATGQRADFPPDLAEQELAFSQAKLGELPPDRSPFAPPQPVADDAPAIDRLAACLGRAVGS